MHLFNLLIIFIARISFCQVGREKGQQGFRIEGKGRYFILAPQRAQAGKTYEIRVSLIDCWFPKIHVRATLSRDDVAYADAIDEFANGKTSRLQLMVPKIARPGKHQLLIEGFSPQNNMIDPFFRNVTEIYFDTMQSVVFIETDRRLYFAGETIKFRVISLTQELLPTSGSINIYVEDGRNYTVNRWLTKQLKMGIYENEFITTKPLNLGNWKIKADVFGHMYENTFRMMYFDDRMYELNVTAPIYSFDSEWGIIVLLKADNHDVGVGENGNVTFSVGFEYANGQLSKKKIKRHLPYVSGSYPELVLFQDARREFGNKLVGGRFKFSAYFTNWMIGKTSSGVAWTRVISDRVDIQLIGPRFRTFKPPTQINVDFAIQKGDGSKFNSLYNRQVDVEIVTYVSSSLGSSSLINTISAANKTLQKRLIPKSGIVHVNVFTNYNDRQVDIRLRHSGSNNEGVVVSFFRYYNPKYHHLSITTSTHNAFVNGDISFTARTNVIVNEIHYVIISKGSILFGDSYNIDKSNTAMSIDFTISTSRLMSPFSRIFAYCFTVDGQVLMDSLNFFVRDERLSNMEMEVNYGKDFSRNTVELIVKGDPVGRVYLSSNEYELYRRDIHSFINEESVVETLELYESDDAMPYKHTWYYDDDRFKETIYFNSPSWGVDALTTISSAGLVVLTDANITQTPINSYCNATYNQGRCLNGQCYSLDNKCNDIVNCVVDGYDELGCVGNYLDKFKYIKQDNSRYMSVISRYFSLTGWTWGSYFLKPDGRTQIKLNVPDTTNPYVINGWAIHPRNGLQLLGQPVQIDATRLFFSVAYAPSFCRRGEHVGIRLYLFNNWEQDLEVTVSMFPGPNFKFVRVQYPGNEYPYLNSYDDKPHETFVRMLAGTTTFIHVAVVPIIVKGEFVVHIESSSVINMDVEDVEIQVFQEGVSNDAHTSYLVDLVNQGSVVIPEFEIPIPEVYWRPDINYNLYVPGSEKALVSIFGDVVSPGFTNNFLGLEQVIERPPYCVDGYLSDIAINLQTLRYLQSTDALQKDNLKTVLPHIRHYLVLQYSFLLTNGAYYMFRDKRTPVSLYMSQFALRVLAGVVQSEWNEDIYVNVKILQTIANFITSNQDNNGCFCVQEIVYNRIVQPSSLLKNGTRQDWYIALTAETVISMAKAQSVIGYKNQIDRAARYLYSKIMHLQDPYHVAITAYALHVAKHPQANHAFQILKEFKRPGEYIYWSNVTIEASEIKTLNTKRYLQRRTYKEQLAEAVLATSYALKLYIANREFDGAMPIMKWIQSQRVLTMGFSGSQVPRAVGQIISRASGTGYALLQARYHWNVEHTWLIRNPKFQTYHLEVKHLSFVGRNASLMNMEICMGWSRPDLSEKSGMTVLTVFAPTGFFMPKSERVKTMSSNVPHLKRLSYSKGRTTMFFEYLTKDIQCLKIRHYRRYPVANVSLEHSIVLFDYYEHGLRNATLYQTFQLHHQHICHVCGSYQCPFCPAYNLGQVQRYSNFCLVFYMIVILLTILYI